MDHIAIRRKNSGNTVRHCRNDPYGSISLPELMITIGVEDKEFTRNFAHFEDKGLIRKIDGFNGLAYYEHAKVEVKGIDLIGSPAEFAKQLSSEG